MAQDVSNHRGVSLSQKGVPLLKLIGVREWNREGSAYPLLSGVGDVSICLEKGSYIQGLSSPDGAMHCPVEGKLQRSAV